MPKKTTELNYCSINKSNYLEPENWKTLIQILKEMFKTIRCINVPSDFEWKGCAIGQIVADIQKLKQPKNEKKNLLEKTKQEALRKLGIVWTYGKTEAQYRQWCVMYNRAKSFFEQHGHLCVSPKADRDLNNWLNVQRNCYNHVRRKRKYYNDVCSFARYEYIAMLNSIGMIWESDTRWAICFEKFTKCQKENGSFYIPYDYVYEDFGLGRWVKKQTDKYHKGQLEKYKIRLLKDAGYNFEQPKLSGCSYNELYVYHYFCQAFPDALLKSRVEGKELDCFSPSQKIAIEYDGVLYHSHKEEEDNEKDHLCEQMGIRLIRIRERGLQATKIAKCYFLQTRNAKDLEAVLKEIWPIEFGQILDCNLQSIGSELFDTYESQLAINKKAELLEDYYKKHGKLPATSNRMGKAERAMNEIRQFLKTNRHAAFRQALLYRLAAIGFPVNAFEEKFEIGFRHAQEYYKQNRNLDVPGKYKAKDGFNLGYWVSHTKRRHPQSPVLQGKPLTEKQIQRLKSIGMKFGFEEDQE